MSARTMAAKPQTEQRAAQPGARPRPEGFERAPLSTYQQDFIELETLRLESLARIGHRMAMAGEEDSKSFEDMQELMVVIEQRVRDLRAVVIAGLASIDEQLAAKDQRAASELALVRGGSAT